MKKITLTALMLAISACGHAPPTEVTIVDNGNAFENCDKMDPCPGTKPPVDSDPR